MDSLDRDINIGVCVSKEKSMKEAGKMVCAPSQLVHISTAGERQTNSNDDDDVDDNDDEACMHTCFLLMQKKWSPVAVAVVVVVAAKAVSF